MHRETSYVVGLPLAEQGSGDPSPLTAYGVYRGMKACCQVYYGSDSLQGRKVAIQGLGKVGYELTRLLVQDGARVVAAELDPKRAIKVAVDLGIRLAGLQEIYDVKCDIFAPCALGAVINDDTLKRLRCRIIAGAANNQLAKDHHGYELLRHNRHHGCDIMISE